MALYALAIGIPAVLAMQSLQAVLEGLERFDLLALARMPVAVLTYAVPAAGAVMGWPLARMILVIVLARAAATVVLYGFYRHSRPSEHEGRARDEWRGLYQYGRWLAVSGVLTQVLLYLDRFLLSAMHGLTAVAHYTAPYDAASKLLAIPGSIGVAMFPGLAKDKARDRREEALMRSRAAGRAIMMILIPLGIALIAAAAPLLRWWLGPDFGAEGIAAFRILVFAVLLHAAAFPPVIAIEAFGRSDAVARYYLIEILVYVPAAYLTIRAYGVTGAAWTWAARNAALMVWSHWYANRKL
jgi:O-antigen/teichoic acid export membrane protein